MTTKENISEVPFETPYLVQRLKKPTGHVNPFSFGGGLRNGGINEDAMNILKQIFSFDYMGSAEFEFGAIPEAFNNLAKLSKEDKLVTCEYDIDGVVVYYICPFSIEDKVLEWIKLVIKNKHLRTKEFIGLDYALKGEIEVKGWLELENPFMFFIDGEMFNNTRKLFGVR